MGISLATPATRSRRFAPLAGDKPTRQAQALPRREAQALPRRSLPLLLSKPYQWGRPPEVGLGRSPAAQAGKKMLGKMGGF